MISWVIAIWVAAVGAPGSFLNVVVYRPPAAEPQPSRLPLPEMQAADPLA